MSGPAFQPYTVPFFSQGFGFRELATLPSEHAFTQLIDYIKSLGGIPNGMWYEFDRDEYMHDTVQRARDLGGIVYNLPVA